MAVLNRSKWEQSVVYHFDRATVWLVRNIYIAAASSALAADEPLTSPTKLSAPMIDLNANSLEPLTTALATEIDHKHRCEKATSAAQA